MALNELFRRGFRLIRHLFADLLPRQFHLLISEERGIFPYFSCEAFRFLQQLSLISLALSAQRRVNRLNFLIQSRQPFSIILHDSFGSLFVFSSTLDQGDNLLPSRAQVIAHCWDNETFD